MRAVVTTAHGGYEKLQFRDDYPNPEAGVQEVVVKVAATAVNFHDLFTRRGMPGVRIDLPVIVDPIFPGRSFRWALKRRPAGSASGCWWTR